MVSDGSITLIPLELNSHTGVRLEIIRDEVQIVLIVWLEPIHFGRAHIKRSWLMVVWPFIFDGELWQAHRSGVIKVIVIWGILCVRMVHLGLRNLRHLVLHLPDCSFLSFFETISHFTFEFIIQDHGYSFSLVSLHQFFCLFIHLRLRSMVFLELVDIVIDLDGSIATLSLSHLLLNPDFM